MRRGDRNVEEGRPHQCGGAFVTLRRVTTSMRRGDRNVEEVKLTRFRGHLRMLGRSSRWERDGSHIRKSFGSRWFAWLDRVERRRIWEESSSRRRRRSGTGSSKPSSMKEVGQTG